MGLGLLALNVVYSEEDIVGGATCRGVEI